VVLDSGYCIFHDKAYLNHYLSSIRDKRAGEVVEGILQKVHHANNTNVPLYCIGYCIPNIDLKEEYKVEVYFDECWFRSSVFFEGSRFHKGASFIYAKFKNANFRDAIFHSVTFRGAIFSESVDF
jgi:uncharacterized protein YjbI with pentapeptide repeats